MPLIRIEYDDAVLSAQEARTLSEATKDIVIEQTGIDSVFVYTNTAQIKVQVAPIEIFIELSAPKAPDPEDLTNRIKDALIAWKKDNNFKHMLNMTLIPMQWQLAIEF